MRPVLYTYLRSIYPRQAEPRTPPNPRPRKSPIPKQKKQQQKKRSSFWTLSSLNCTRELSFNSGYLQSVTAATVLTRSLLTLLQVLDYIEFQFVNANRSQCIFSITNRILRLCSAQCICGVIVRLQQSDFAFSVRCAFTWMCLYTIYIYLELDSPPLSIERRLQLKRTLVASHHSRSPASPQAGETFAEPSEPCCSELHSKNNYPFNITDNLNNYGHHFNTNNDDDRLIITINQLARQLYILNSNTSLLLSLPPELLKLVIFYIVDPLDLLRFSYTCHELFFITAPADWYSLATYTYTNWVQSCGGPKARDWKTMVLKDAALGVRLGATLPLPDVITSTSSPISSALTTVSSPSTSALSLISETSPNTTTDVIPSRPRPSPHPPPLSVDSKWSQWATSTSCRLPSSLDEFDRRRPLRVKLSEAQFFETDQETRDAPGAPWVRMGSPIYNIDKDSHTAIAASMITRPKTVPSKSNGGDPRPHDHEILFYNLPDLTNPIARCGSDVWEKDKKTSTQAQPWYHPFTRDMMQVAQVVEIKHYPEDTAGGMRVVVVIAFGQRARPWVNNATDSHILGVWLMLKVIEVRVPVTPMTRLSNWMMNHFKASPSLEPTSLEPEVARKCVRINPDNVVKYESLEPRQHQITMHGRIVKLYSALEPRPLPTTTTGGDQPSTPMDVDTGRKVDCIAIFGTQNSDVASAMVIKKVLFCDDDASDLGRKTYSNKAVSRGVSCMTLFPDHSGYEHYLVLFNQHGRGMVWDWVHEKQITQLHMPIDKSKSKGDRRVGDEPANIGVVTGSTLATAGNPAGDAGVGGASSPRRRVYYWGVQVSAALEVSFPEDLNNVDNNNGTFRIVTMADGADDEWESCWWNITMDELRDPMASLPAPPIIDRNKSGSSSNATNAAKPPLISSVKRFERKTYGICIPEQQRTHSAENNKPIQFIAYVIWNHYRIGLSSRMGICMVDLEEPESGLVADRQWITFLKEREDLIDIAIFGHNLVVTLKTGHLVWSFYGQDRTPFVSKEGLGLRMDTEGSLESDSMNNRPAFVQ